MAALSSEPSRPRSSSEPSRRRNNSDWEALDAEDLTHVSEEPLAGKLVLVVWLKGAAHLDPQLSRDWSGKADPYAILHLGKLEQRQRSTHCAQTLNPAWHPSEKFQFLIESDDLGALYVQMMDWDWGSTDDELGECVLNLRDVELHEERASKVLQVRHPETNEPISEVFIEVKLTHAEVALSEQEQMIIERQRSYQPSKYIAGLLPTDPSPFAKLGDENINGKTIEDVVAQLEEPDDETIRPWHISGGHDVSGGWRYAPPLHGDFKSHHWLEKPAFGTAVRKRIHQRVIRRKAKDMTMAQGEAVPGGTEATSAAAAEEAQPEPAAQEQEQQPSEQQEGESLE